MVRSAESEIAMRWSVTTWIAPGGAKQPPHACASEGAKTVPRPARARTERVDFMGGAPAGGDDGGLVYVTSASGVPATGAAVDFTFPRETPGIHASRLLRRVCHR